MEKPVFELEAADKKSDAELADIFFGKDYRILGNLSMWARENKERYATIRRIAETDTHRLAKPAREQVVEMFKKPAPRTTDAEEIRIRQLYTAEDADRILANQRYGHADNLVTLAKHDPMKAYELKLALWSYGKLINRPVRPEPKKQSNESTFELSESLCKEMNLPVGTHVTHTQFAKIVGDVAVARHEREQREQSAQQTAHKGQES